MGVRPSAGPKIVLAAVGRELVPPPARFAIRCGADSPPTPLHRIRFSLHRNAFWCIETRFGAPKRVLALRNVFWRSDPSAERGWVALRLSASLTPIRWPGNRSGDPYCLPFSFLSWTSTGVPSFGICFRRSGVIVIRGCTCWRPPTRTQSSRSRPCRMTRRPSS